MAVTSMNPNKRRYILGGLFIGGVIAACIFVVYHWEYVTRFEHLGYLGLFLITILTGSPPPVPVPYMIIIFTFGAVLKPQLVGLVSGIGLTVGAVLLYLTGRGGRHFLPQFNISDPSSEGYSSRLARFLRKIKLQRILDFANRRGTLAVFVFSVLPNPFFAPMVVTMGTTRFSFTKFFLSCLAGQTAKAMVLAYLGYFGLSSLLRYFGIFHVP
jgi:membrane protein DedA with SNARE-associated domain